MVAVGRRPRALAPQTRSSSITVAANTYTSVVHELESEHAKAEAAAVLVPSRRRRHIWETPGGERFRWAAGDSNPEPMD
jgi:hypothetical protein